MIEFESKKLIEELLPAEKLTLFLDLVKKANARFNLYSRNLAREDLLVLVAESLIPLKLGWLDGFSDNVLDIGSGWGIPAVPWRLAGYTGGLIMIERSQKKADFLLLLANRLDIRLDVVCQNFEQFTVERTFSAFSFRGVATSRTLMKKLNTLAGPNARLISFGPPSEAVSPESVELFEYRIDNLPVRKLYKMSLG